MASGGRADVLTPLLAAPGGVQAAWERLGTDRCRVVIDTLVTVELLAPKMGNGPFDPGSVRVAWRGD
jgi:hypothetical protein